MSDSQERLGVANMEAFQFRRISEDADWERANTRSTQAWVPEDAVMGMRPENQVV